MNVVSLGDLNKKMKEANIDKLRHLYVVLNINGKDYMFEKDEVIKVQPYQARSGQETLTLGQPKNNKTVSHHIGIEIFILPFINFLFCYDSVVNYWSALLWNIAIIFLLGKGYSIKSILLGSMYFP